MYVGVHVQVDYTHEEVLESPSHLPPSPPYSVFVPFLFKPIGKIFSSSDVIHFVRIYSALTEKERWTKSIATLITTPCAKCAVSSVNSPNVWKGVFEEISLFCVTRILAYHFHRHDKELHGKGLLFIFLPGRVGCSCARHFFFKETWSRMWTLFHINCQNYFH
jgi:hypothetical protein